MVAAHRRHDISDALWKKLLEIVVDDPDFEWLMIDASYIKVHHDGMGAKGGSQDMGRTKGGLTQRYIWPWMRMVCRSEWLSRQVPWLIVEKLAIS